MARYEVIIVGGGPVGMGLAIELGQRGISVAVVEKYKKPQPIPKGQNLTQRTMEHMQSWGVEEKLRSARTIPASYGIGGLTAYGSLLSGWHYDWLQRDLVARYYAAGNERLPQYKTEEVLRGRVAELEIVDVFYGYTADVVSQTAQETLVTAHNKVREELSLTADYAVGCDGANSLLRNQSAIVQTCREHDRKMVLLVFRSRELHELLAAFPGKSYYNVLEPELKGYWRFLGRVDLGETWFYHAPVDADLGEDADFAAMLHETVGAEFKVELEHVGFWDLRFAIADNYQDKRLFIAGDAAHSHPPYGGYGVNSGLEDVRNLGWKLTASLRGWGSDALLASYSQERAAVFHSTSEDFIEASIKNDGDFLASYSPEKNLEVFEAEWAARGSGAVDEVNKFEPNYEGSPIISGANNAKPSAIGSHMFEARPGHHLAPYALPDGRNLFDHLGAGFTLFDFSGEGLSASFAELAATKGMPLDVVVETSKAAAHYKNKLLLVRPDNFVSWVGNKVPDNVDEVLNTAIGYS